MSDYYTRQELEECDLPKFPTKGLYCQKCKTWIPQFEDLGGRVESRIRKLIRTGRSEMAMRELESAVGCNQRWAKIWVVHSGKPTAEYPGPPCPHCGGTLRTTMARQCPHCFKAWHTE